MTVRRIECQPGPQLQAMRSKATVVVYGGAAGGGKSFLQAMRAAKYHNVPNYSAALFRRTYPMLQGSGSLWDECMGIYPSLGAHSTTRPLEFTWDYPSRVEFRPLQHAGDELDHKSKQYAYIGFDEGSDFLGQHFSFMLSRLRTTCGVRTQFFVTTNPDPDCYLRDWIDWWIGDDGFPIPERVGKVRFFVRAGKHDEIVWADDRDDLAKYVDDPEHEIMSMTFILSKVTDNKILMKADPSYLAKLKSLRAVDRARFLAGNWDARESAGDFYQQAWFKVWGSTALERLLMGQDGPPGKVVQSVRWWDFAGTPVQGDLVPGIARPEDFKARDPKVDDPDYSCGVKLCRTRDQRIIVDDAVFYRDTGGAIEAAVERQALIDGPETVVGLWQDPGAAAMEQCERLVRRLRGKANVQVVAASKKKEEYAREPSRAAYKGAAGLGQPIHYRIGPWNSRFFNQLQAFPGKKGVDHDDAVDALSGAWLHLAEHGGPLGPGYLGANRPLVKVYSETSMKMLPPNRDLERMRSRAITKRFGHRLL